MVVLNLMVNNYCNLECSYCYIDSCKINSNERKEMKLNDVDQILRMTRDQIEMVHVFGGEPFLHGEIEEMCRLIDDYDLPINIATNGLMVEHHASWLSRLEVSLAVNMVGNDPALNELIGMEYPIQQTTRNAKLLVENNVDVNAIICPFPVRKNVLENAGWYSNFMENINRETGVNTFFILYFSRIGRGVNCSKINMDFFRPDNWLLFLRLIRQHFLKSRSELNVFCEPAFESEDFLSLPPAFMQCEMTMETNIVIRYDMQAFPCILLLSPGHLKFSKQFSGNIKAQVQEFIKMKDDFLNINAIICKTCSESDVCGPCIPYVVEMKNDYRCYGNKSGSLMGCPLMTTRLF
ncbi:MAG: radical SAM protein [Promethearchaeota archaeon]